MRVLPVLGLGMLLLLSACSTNNRPEKELKNTYNSFVESILDNNGVESIDVPFSHTLEVEFKEDQQYHYTITIDDPRVAMYNIQMIVVDKNSVGEYPYIGFAADDVFHMIPHQENKEKSFMKGIILGGSSPNAQLNLDVQVTWKDYAQVNSQTAFLHFDYNYDEEHSTDIEEGQEE